MLKNKIFWFFVLSLVGFASSLILKDSVGFGLCLASEPSCIVSLTKVSIGLFYGMGALALVFLLLLFIPRAVSAWWKFAIWYVPLAAFAIATAGPTGAMIDLGPTVKDTALWLSGMYVVVSAAIIAIVAIRRKT